MGFPVYFAYIAGVLEFFGGLLLIVGLFTRIAGLLLSAEMAVALVKVHGMISNPMAVDSYQFPLACAVGSFAVAAMGAGILSLDHAVFANRRGAGAGGFPADVKDGGALLGHAFGMRQGRRRIQVKAAVREGVGGDIEHAHDDGCL